MRFLLMFLCYIVAAMPLYAEVKSEPKGAHITFDTTEYDFGEISRADNNKSCSFRFVNSGTEPLVLLSATTSCSCLKAEFPRKPIAVGEQGEVRLILESKKVDKGVFRRVVQIRSTSTGGTEILTIKGIIKD